MNADQPRTLLTFILLGRSNASHVRATVGDVFAQVVAIDLLKCTCKATEDRDLPTTAWWNIADLKVDQPRLTIVSYDDVFAFVQVDIRHAPTVYLPQDLAQCREERIIHGFAITQRMPFDVAMGDCVR